MDKKDRSIQDILHALKALRLQEAELSTELEAALLAKETTPKEPENKNQSIGYTRGDRIWIKNKIKRPANWTSEREWDESEAKTATVTEVITIGTNNVQIHFITDNGVHTWRAPNNVNRIQHERR